MNSTFKHEIEKHPLIRESKRKKIRFTSKRLNILARISKRYFKTYKERFWFDEWADCDFYAPTMRKAVRLVDTKYFETKINQRRKRIPRDYCRPEINFYQRHKQD